MEPPRARRVATSHDVAFDVLIVEDERIQCEELAGFLSRARRYTPRVALLDDNLRDIAGVQLAQKLRTAFPEMAILIASGRIDRLSEETSKALGITVFVNKPLPLDPLRAKPSSTWCRPRRSTAWRNNGTPAAG